MNDKKIFDLLDNAENDSMKRLIDKCPEISDKQLDKILAMSERKFRKMEKEYDNKGITMTENDVVEGVERSRRPAWVAPLRMAASLVLVAGVIAGSTALLNRNGSLFGNDSDDPYAATAAATIPVGTVIATTVTGGTDTSATEAASDPTDTTTEAATETATEEATEIASGAFDINAIAGEWTYQESNGSHPVENGARNVAHVFINSDSTYTYTDAEGNTVNGTVKIGSEEIDGTKLTPVSFNEGSSHRFTSYWFEGVSDEMHIGNGGMARLVRGSKPLVKEENKDMERVDAVDISDIEGTWTYQESDGSYTVDRGAKNLATVFVSSDGSYSYTDADGNTTYGSVEKTYEELNGVNMPYFDFVQSGVVRFHVLYVSERPNEMYTGNGGMARLIRGSLPLTQTDTRNLGLLPGLWTYQVSDGNYTVDRGAVDAGTMEIGSDATYKFTDADGNLYYGDIRLSSEEIGGTEFLTIGFWEGADLRFSGTLVSDLPDEIRIGNGGLARLVRS